MAFNMPKNILKLINVCIVDVSSTIKNPSYNSCILFQSLLICAYILHDSNGNVTMSEAVLLKVAAELVYIEEVTIVSLNNDARMHLLITFRFEREWTLQYGIPCIEQLFVKVPLIIYKYNQFIMNHHTKLIFISIFVFTIIVVVVTLQYTESYVDFGNRVEILDDLNIKPTLYFDEMSPSEFTKLLKTIPTVGINCNTRLRKVTGLYEAKSWLPALQDIRKYLLTMLNNMLIKFDSYTSDIHFEVVRDSIISIEHYDKFYVVNCFVVVHRESKMVGYTLDISVVFDEHRQFNGISKIRLYGYLSEDKLFLLNNTAPKRYANDVIMHSSAYEEAIIKKQQGDLLLDRGISRITET